MDALISSGYITTNYTCFPCLAITHLLTRSLICSLTFSANSRLLIRTLTHLLAHSFARWRICMLSQLHPHPFARSLIHLLICLLTNSFAFLLAVSVARSLNHLLTLCSLTHCLLTRFYTGGRVFSCPNSKPFWAIVRWGWGGMAVLICPEPNDLWLGIYFPYIISARSLRGGNTPSPGSVKQPP